MAQQGIRAHVHGIDQCHSEAGDDGKMKCGRICPCSRRNRASAARRAAASRSPTSRVRFELGAPGAAPRERDELHRHAEQQDGELKQRQRTIETLISTTQAGPQGRGAVGAFARDTPAGRWA